MRNISTKAEAIRSQMAVFNYDGTNWIVIRGFKGTEILGRFNNQQDAQALCEKHNVELAKSINA